MRTRSRFSYREGVEGINNVIQAMFDENDIRISNLEDGVNDINVNVNLILNRLDKLHDRSPSWGHNLSSHVDDSHSEETINNQFCHHEGHLEPTRKIVVFIIIGDMKYQSTWVTYLRRYALVSLTSMESFILMHILIRSCPKICKGQVEGDCQIVMVQYWREFV